MRHRLIGIFFSCILVAAGSCLHAQSGGVPRELFSPDLLPEQKLTDKEQETIERALGDLEDENPEYRAGAVMLLGKYEARKARAAVIDALGDPEARVRRAALVSVMEWSRNAPPEVVEPVLQMLGDPDVEIRRMASSALPSMLSVLQMRQLMRAPGAQFQMGVPNEAKPAVRAAFEDEDAVVRRNLLNYYNMLGVPADASTIVRWLQDSDREVRLTAMPIGASRLGVDAFVDAVEPLMKTEGRIWKLRLVRELMRVQGEPSRELLLRLREDDDPDVAGLAGINLFRMFTRDAYLDWIFERFMQGRLNQDQSVEMVRMLMMRGDDAGPRLRELLEVDDAVVRAEAARQFFGTEQAFQEQAILVRLLNDRSANVRAQAISFWRRQPSMLPLETLGEMVFSDYKDVREGMIGVLSMWPDKGQARELMIDLLLDEATSVRLEALQNFAFKRYDGWRDFLLASLEDSNSEIWKKAIDLILRSRDRDLIQGFGRFLDEHPDSPVRAAVEEMMREREAKGGM